MKNVPDSYSPETTPLQWFPLFWNEHVWLYLGEKTIIHAGFLREIEQMHYATTNLLSNSLTVQGMKIFFALKIGMETAVYKTS